MDKIIIKRKNIFYEQIDIPIYSAHIKTLDFSHIVNAVPVEDSLENYESWYFHDRMNDIFFEGNLKIPNSTVSIRVDVFGHIANQDNYIANSVEYSNLEIVRFKINNKRIASLDYLRTDIDLNPDESTVKEYIQTKYSVELNKKKNLEKKKPILVDQKYCQLFVDQAKYFFHKRNYYLAASCMLDAKRLHPDKAEYLESLGYLMYLMGTPDEALAEYEFAKMLYLNASLKTVPASLYHKFASAYIRKKDYVKAEDNLKQAIAIDSRFVLAYLDLGYLYELKGQLTRAMEYYKQSLIISPKSTFANKRIGIIYFHYGDIKLMVKHLQLAFKGNKKTYMQNKEDPEITKVFGEIFFYYKKSLSYYQNEIKKNAADINAHYNLGILYESLNKINPSTEHLDKSIYFFKKAADLGSVEAILWLKENK